MATVKKGDKVLINYTGKLEDGSIFDTTIKETGCGCDDDSSTSSDCGCGDEGCDDDGCGCETGLMEVTIGAEDFFPQVEESLIGMAPGEKKTVTIPAADAFGEYDEEEVFSISREQLTGDIVPEVGMELELTGDDDEPV